MIFSINERHIDGVVRERLRRIQSPKPAAHNDDLRPFHLSGVGHVLRIAPMVQQTAVNPLACVRIVLERNPCGVEMSADRGSLDKQRMRTVC